MRTRGYGGVIDAGSSLDDVLLSDDGGGGNGGGAGSEDEGGSEPALQESEMVAPESSLQQALHRYMHKVHIPLLHKRPVQLAVLLTFLTGLCLSIVAIPHLSVGLDQAVALPRDSYLQDYYRAVFADLRVGPPLLLVVNNLSVDHDDPDVAAVCAAPGCRQDSVMNMVAQAARTPHRSRIATPAASWLDDFISWLSPSLPMCCRAHGGVADAAKPSLPDEDLASMALRAREAAKHQAPRLIGSSETQQDYVNIDGKTRGSGSDRASSSEAWGGIISHNKGGNNGDNSNASGYCPPPDQPPCADDAGACMDCAACVATAFDGGRPSARQFVDFLPWFLDAMPSEQCAKAGAGAYGNAVARDDSGAIAGFPPAGGDRPPVVSASSFRAYHTPLNSQSDFIAALRSTRSLVMQLRATLGLDVYAYSPFHVFFEQYLTVYADGAALVGAPALAIFFAAWALLGSAASAALLVAVLLSLLLHLCGAMLLAGIQLNAVSLVNMAMALGIAVEFCAHVVHAFGVAVGSRARRMATALERTGASVLSGITLTKLVGVAVLAFARTQIFEIYYFRLYLALVVLGAAHGLVLLPVLLSLVGPPSWTGQALA